MDFSAVVCKIDTLSSVDLDVNSYSVEVWDSSLNKVTVTSPVLDTTAKTYYAAVPGGLVSGKSYFFKVLATNVGGLVTKFDSSQWLVDATIPNAPSSVKLSSAFTNSLTTSPSLTLFTVSDLQNAVGLKNVDIKDSFLEVYNSDSAGVSSGAALITSTAFAKDLLTYSPISSLSLTDGKYYTVKMKTEDNLLQMSSLSASNVNSTWLVDTTLPVISYSFASSRPIYSNFKVIVPLKGRADSVAGNLMIKDPVPSGGVAASGIDESKIMIYLFKKTDTSGPSVNSGATAVASQFLSATDFGNTLNWTVSPAADIYRLAFSVTDKAGNISGYYVDSNDITITTTLPSCTGTLSLSSRSANGNSFVSGSDIFVTSNVNSPDLNFSSFVCVDGLGHSVSNINIEFWRAGDSSATGTPDADTLPKASAFNKTFSTALLTGYKYLFKVVPVDSNGLKGLGISTSNDWAVDNVAPGIPSSPALASNFMNVANFGGTTSPTISWGAVLDYPGSLNSGLKQYNLKFYTSNSLGARNSLLSGTGTSASTSFQKTSGSFSDGNYYTAEILAEDNVGNISSSVGANPSFKWLVDLTLPTIESAPISAGTANKAAKQITLTFAATIAKDLVPVGGVAASGIDSTSYSVKFRNVNSGTDTSAFSFSPGGNSVFTLSSNGKFRAVLTVKDLAGNQSAEFIYPVDFLLSDAPTLNLTSAAVLNSTSSYPEINGGNASAFAIGITCSTDSSDTTSHDIDFTMKGVGTISSTSVSFAAKASCLTGVVTSTPSNFDFSNISTFPDGNYNLTGTFVDVYGVTATKTLNLTKDSRAKILTFVFDAQKNAGPPAVVNNSGLGRYGVGDVNSLVSFSGTCSGPGTVKIYLNNNNGVTLAPSVSLDGSQSNKALLVTSAPATEFSTNCSASGSEFTFSGNFDYSQATIGGNIGVYAVLTPSSGPVSANSTILYSKISSLRIPWVAEYNGSVDPATYPAMTLSSIASSDLDLYQSETNNPPTAWGQPVGISIGGCKKYAVYYVFDHVGVSATNKPTAKGDWASGGNYTLLSSATQASSCGSSYEIQPSIAYNPGAPGFTGSMTSADNLVFTCVSAFNSSDSEGPITCSDGYKIDNLCPRDFIAIFDATVGNFCVSKYEMRIDSGNIVPGVPLASNTPLNGSLWEAAAVSGIAINDYDSALNSVSAACATMSDVPGDYTLINNKQWNVVGSRIAMNSSNLYGSASSRNISQGLMTMDGSISDPSIFSAGANQRYHEIKVNGVGKYIHDFAGGRAEIVYTRAAPASGATGYLSGIQLDFNFNSSGPATDPFGAGDAKLYFSSTVPSLMNRQTFGGFYVYTYSGATLGAVVRGGGKACGYAQTLSTCASSNYSTPDHGIFDTVVIASGHFGHEYQAGTGLGFRCVSKQYASPYKGM